MKTLFLALLSIIFAIEPSKYMEKFRSDIVTPEPPLASSRNSRYNYGQVKKIIYDSKFCSRQKEAIVILPAGYSLGENCPVVYINHGIFGSANDMLNEDLAIQTIAVNLMATEEAEPMILVFTNMWSSKINAKPAMRFDEETSKGYDDFLYDLTQDLIPYIEANFNVRKGRENRAISGFNGWKRSIIYRYF